MSRYRSKGDRSTVFATRTGSSVKSVRRVLSGGVWTKEYKNESLGDSLTVTRDDRESFYDSLGRTRYNPCSHVKRIPYSYSVRGASSSGPIPDWLWSPNIWYTYSKDNGTFNDIVSFQGLLVQGDVINIQTPYPDWADLVNTVGIQLDGRMTTSQNLLVDAMQFSQTIGMFKNPFNLPKLLRKNTGLTLSKLAKYPAGAYLEYKFGWENIYRSIIALRDVWSEVRSHRQYLEDSVCKYTSLAARQTTSVSNPSYPMRSLLFQGYLSLVPRISLVETNYCFSLDVRRTAAALAWSKMDQVLSRLGVRDLAEALWDCVPYSFVVDWFTHVNRFIAQKPIEWNSFDLRYVGFSQKTTVHGYLEVTSLASDQMGGYQYLNFNTGTQIVQKSYERFTGFPSGTSSVGLFGNLNKTQIAEGIALIIQRL